MKKVSILMVALFIGLVVSLFAALPLTEYFSGPSLVNTWEQFWTQTATLTSVTAGTDGIPDPAFGNGWIGKTFAEPTTYMSAGNITGDWTDTNYTLKSWVWVPVVNTVAEPDDFWYQMLIFYDLSIVQDPTTYGYGRFHTQFNLADVGANTPRIRLQITNPAFAYTLAWSSNTADFPAPTTSGWHELKIALTGTTALCYYDGAQLAGTADWTVAAPTRSAGKFGFGQFIDGPGSRAVYVDNFKAWTTGGSEPADQPTPTPPPTATPTPTGFADAQHWTWYE